MEFRDVFIDRVSWDVYCETILGHTRHVGTFDCECQANAVIEQLINDKVKAYKVLDLKLEYA